MLVEMKEVPACIQNFLADRNQLFSGLPSKKIGIQKKLPQIFDYAYFPLSYRAGLFFPGPHSTQPKKVALVYAYH